jgi:hypothetical protein
MSFSSDVAPFDFYLHWNSQKLIRILILTRLLRSGIQPNPGTTNSSACVTFLQLNCNGIKNSLTEINSYLNESKVKIACFQETKLTSKSKDPVSPNYHVLQRDRPGGGGQAGGVSGGGVITFIYHFAELGKSARESADPLKSY